MTGGSRKQPGLQLPPLTRRSLLLGAGGAAVSAASAVQPLRRRAEHVIVVGAGAFGAWTAHHLLKAGHRVTLVDSWGPAHSRASSGGETRMTRAAYGKDSVYTRMALDSLSEWKALGDREGLPLFHQSGVLFFFADPTADYLHDSLRVHTQLVLPTRALGRAEMARRFPMIDFDGIEVGIHEPTFGVLMARRSIQALVDRFVRSGGNYLRADVLAPPADAEKVDGVTTKDGERLAADRIVFALGPWLPKLFPDVIGRRIQPTRQEVFFFAPPAGDRRFLPSAMPGWADFNGGDVYYGMPDIEARGVKFAHDAHGPEVDPDLQDRLPTSAALERVIAFRDRRFPLLRGAPLTEARVCQYENSSNGDFLIDFHPRLKNVLLVGGGSGHGFKHGPEVGRIAAARLFDSIAPEPRFSLATKAEAHKREVI